MPYLMFELITKSHIRVFTPYKISDDFSRFKSFPAKT